MKTQIFMVDMALLGVSAHINRGKPVSNCRYFNKFKYEESTMALQIQHFPGEGYQSACYCRNHYLHLFIAVGYDMPLKPYNLQSINSSKWNNELFSHVYQKPSRWVHSSGKNVLHSGSCKYSTTSNRF